MRLYIKLLVLLFFISLPSIASNEQEVSFVGNLINVNSSLKKIDAPELKALLENAPSNNYVFYSNNHWFLLDKKGNDLARDQFSDHKIDSATKSFMIKVI